MDKETLHNMAVTAFNNLGAARANLFTATEAEITAKAKLEDAKYQAYVGGVITGTNDKLRDAQIKEHCQADYANLALAEKQERGAHFGYDTASVEVDTLKTLLRIAELV
jgi:hypothetical protein